MKNEDKGFETIWPESPKLQTPQKTRVHVPGAMPSI